MKTPDTLQVTLVNLLLVGISIFQFQCLIFLYKNNLTNPLLNVKIILINKVISPVGETIAVINHAILILPLVTERTNKFI